MNEEECLLVLDAIATACEGIVTDDVIKTHLNGIFDRITEINMDFVYPFFDQYVEAQKQAIKKLAKSEGIFWLQ